MSDDPTHDETDTAAIAARLRIARARRFRRPEDAAAAAGIPLATWYGHENGSRGLRTPTLARIRAALGVSLDWLVTGQGPVDTSSSSADSTVPMDPAASAIDAPAGTLVELSLRIRVPDAHRRARTA